MAAHSRPSLRSTLHKAPTVLHFDGLPPPKRRGKRAHDTQLGTNVDRLNKKQKLVDAKDSLLSPSSPNHAVKAFSALANSPPSAVTQPTSPPRIAGAVQPLSNGTITTNPSPQSRNSLGPIGKSTRDARKHVKESEKRTLRSQDGGSRSKSELSLYFPNYDEIISNEPKEPDFLGPETRFFITEDPKLTSSNITPTKTLPHRPLLFTSPIVNGSSHTKTPSTKSLLVLNEATQVDFSSLIPSTPPTLDDPLPDSVYFFAHRRAERQEKQLRNIEKERASHEKVQLERLLDGLRGHDWLRVMGISGITDSEKKAFEPKREYFIKEVSALIAKFKAWKEEEKRRKIEKVEAAADEDEEEESADEEAEPPTKRKRMSGVDRSSDAPDLSDVDAWAARQLHQEAISATGPRPPKASRTHKHSRNSSATTAHLLPSHTTSLIEKPFTSFYDKPYLRDAAIGKHRRGRTRFAFGQPLPDVEEREFALPDDMLTEEAIRASARSRRRAKRGGRE